MISVSEATQLLLQSSRTLSTEKIAFSKAQGRTLAEDLVADRDYPPFDRICMDGIALHSNALHRGSFNIQQIARAGEPVARLLNPEDCIEVMTGCPLPIGCNTNIRYEDLNIEKGTAQLKEALPLKAGANIHPKGSDYQKGAVLVSAGTVLQASHIGIAASIGKATLSVSAQPKIAIISTGDELVEVDQIPLDHQIRRSNIYALQALLHQNHFFNTTCLHAQDKPEILEQVLAQATTENDVVLLSGGVSMGKFDFVPQTLQKLKVEEIFYKVAMRPGKPLWFGKSTAGTAVFGLPGNPVSTLAACLRFVIPFLQSATTQKTRHPLPLKLAQDLIFKPNLTWFLPVSLGEFEGSLAAIPQPTNGSGDFNALGNSSGILEFPAEETHFRAGQNFTYYPWSPLS